MRSFMLFCAMLLQSKVNFFRKNIYFYMLSNILVFCTLIYFFYNFANHCRTAQHSIYL